MAATLPSSTSTGLIPPTAAVNIAFLYRMRERDVITDRLRNDYYSKASAFLDNLDIEFSAAMEGNTPPQAMKEISTLFEGYEQLAGDHIYKIANLVTLKETLTGFLKQLPQDKKIPEKISSIIKKGVEKIKKNLVDEPSAVRATTTLAYQKACEDYFGEYFTRRKEDKEKFAVLSSTGKLYCPPGRIHTWEKNLHWLMDRFKHGATFVIMSEVNTASRVRSNKKTDSGFFREVATCYALGYRFEKTGDDIVMKHPNVGSLKNINVQNIQMSVAEMEKHYALAMKDFEELTKKKVLPSLPQASVIMPMPAPSRPLLFGAGSMMAPSVSNHPVTVQIISQGMNAKDAEYLRQNLIQAGIPSYLLVRSHTPEAVESYQITIATDEAKYIQKTREVMARMNIAAVPSIITIARDDGSSPALTPGGK